MLSRVADSLYWMSRYFERADHSARVLDANYNLMLNPSKVSTEQRWQRITATLGLGAEAAEIDPLTAMIKLISDSQNRSSIVSCIATARENASQVREQISSEMWERLNQLYHEVTQSRPSMQFQAEPQRFITVIREGSYNFHGVTHATMNHGEAWQFIRLGRYMERAGALPVLLDAVFCASSGADDLDWVGLLASCSAFEAYCKVYTADLKPERVAEFLLLNPEFPYTVRFSAEQMQEALEAIARASSTRKGAQIEKIIGRLRSSLAYAQIDDIMSKDFQRFLRSITEQCQSLHTAMHDVYIEYPMESAFEA
ncbi:MAG: alpha-E domain-containing protein [Acidobacteriaceae bacterium]|nr:alpha-E domain-containing protein [Acidobacteriaceae bacterium]